MIIFSDLMLLFKLNETSRLLLLKPATLGEADGIKVHFVAQAVQSLQPPNDLDRQHVYPLALSSSQKPHAAFQSDCFCPTFLQSAHDQSQAGIRQTGISGTEYR
jgi:hypothetical protein